MFDRCSAIGEVLFQLPWGGTKNGDRGTGGYTSQVGKVKRKKEGHNWEGGCWRRVELSLVDIWRIFGGYFVDILGIAGAGYPFGKKLKPWDPEFFHIGKVVYSVLSPTL